MGDDDNKNTSWCNLPGELLRSVASRLLLKEIVLLSAVCKSWLSAISPLLSKQYSSLPLLLTLPYSFQKEGDKCFLFSPWNGETYEVDVPDLSGKSLLCCKEAWILLRLDCYVFMLNIFSGSRVDLPPLMDIPWSKVRSSSLSGTPSSSSNWAVVLLVYCDTNDRVYAATWSNIGEKDWKNIYLGTGEIIAMGDVGYRAVYLDGLFYYLIGDGRGTGSKLATFDPKTMAWSVLSDPNLILPAQDQTQYYLSEFRGELYSVKYHNMDPQLRVFKLDKCKRRWKEVDDIGRKAMMFLNIRGALMVESSVGVGIGNRIYMSSVDKPIVTVTSTTMARLSDMLFCKPVLQTGAAATAEEEEEEEELAPPCFAKLRQNHCEEDSSETNESCGGVYYSFEDHSFHPSAKPKIYPSRDYFNSAWILPRFSRT